MKTEKKEARKEGRKGGKRNKNTRMNIPKRSIDKDL